MEIVTIVTDYLKNSLLTTKGDLLKHGASEPERFGIGSANEVLKMNAAGDDIEYGGIGKLLSADREDFSNAGVITVLNTETIVINATLANVVLGEFIITQCRWQMTKGGTAGGTYIRIRTEGTGGCVISAIDTHVDLKQEYYHQASGVYDHSILMVSKCTTAGAARSILSMSSAGSNGTIGIGAAQIGVYHII